MTHGDGPSATHRHRGEMPPLAGLDGGCGAAVRASAAARNSNQRPNSIPGLAGDATMLIDVLDRDVTLDEGTLEWIERRLQFALGRFAGRIRRVQVTLSNINGHRGDTGKQCRLRITLISKEEILVEDVDATVEAVTANAVERAARSVARWLERQRDFGTAAESALLVPLSRFNGSA
ncbi:MAG: HPF/RaiA family ribosome-associated protein [Planctomycetota bacterium]|nr:MAG: HPF/RaiA family ribosome-associated protein [Planctomycetota bacterium]